MTWLIWRIRMWFCRHDMERHERMEDRFNGGGFVPTVRVAESCKHCGWRRTYWKFW